MKQAAHQAIETAEAHQATGAVLLPAHVHQAIAEVVQAAAIAEEAAVPAEAVVHTEDSNRFKRI
jgi:hypothetical protein